jgi:hypothetical protein
MRRVLPLLLLAVATACTGQGAARTPRATTPGLTVDPGQYRDDVVADRLQLTITNRTGSAIEVAGIQLVWAGMTTGPTPHPLTIGDGQRVDLPVPVGAAVCSIDGAATGAAPSVDDARAVLTLADGSTRIAAVNDADGTLTGLFDAACERQMIAEQIIVRFTDVVEADIDGRPVSVGNLTVQRRRSTGIITVVDAGDTIPFRLHFPDAVVGGSILQLSAAEQRGSIGVQFLEGRCDAHAVAEAKQPFRFVLQIDLGDGIVRPLAVEPEPVLHEAMLAVVARGCQALGDTGTLSPGG